MAVRGMEFAQSWLDAIPTEDELTNTATEVIAIITVCATLSVVAGIKTVCYSASFCSMVLVVSNGSCVRPAGRIFEPLDRDCIRH